MNLRASKLGLILLSALVFFSCEEDELNTIGLPPENELGIFFVDIPLEDAVSQVWINNISSRRTGAIFAGNYTDPALGEITAQNYSEFLLPAANPGKLLEEDATLDSIVMELRINDAVGVDLLSTPQTIEIYQLQDTIVSFERTYYNESTQPVTTKLGEETFYIYPDSINLLFSETKLPDSAEERSLYDTQGRYIYKTNIRIDDAFAQSFFNEMKDTTSNSTFSTNENFADFLKGMRFNGVPGNSAIMTYNATSAYTNLVVYYTQTEEGEPVNKTIRFAVNSAISYNNVTPNGDQPWTGGALDGLTSFYQPFETETDQAYVMSGTHLFMKLDLSAFRSFGDTLENPIIQNAALVLENPVEYPSEQVRLPLPERLNVTVTSLDSLESGVYNAIQDVASDIRPGGAAIEYNSDNNQYKLELPVHLQTLVDDENQYDQLILSAVTENPFTGAQILDNNSLRRLMIDKSNIRIRMYYTIPNSNQ